METAGRHDVYYRPHHPYTAGLLNRLAQTGTRASGWSPLPGQPRAYRPATGVPVLGPAALFHPKCRTVPLRCDLLSLGGPPFGVLLPIELTGRSQDVDEARQRASAAEGGGARRSTWSLRALEAGPPGEREREGTGTTATSPLGRCSACAGDKHFPVRSGSLSRRCKRRCTHGTTSASMSSGARRWAGGGDGSGKSTLARCMMRWSSSPRARSCSTVRTSLT